jgi:hypothetical protein
MLSTVNKKATIIQKVWRGHHAYLRCFYLRVKRRLHQDHQRYMRLFRAAVKIQKVWRGFIVR